ncbi:MAG: UvrB/UvrC motif-containing protein [candidate division WOR-3 bacterium]|nr:UvrB/UvrC motif-containing protein [candidate division WOR-3 bacterium]
MQDKDIKCCSLCHKPEVVIIISTIDKDGKVLDLALCKECAEKKGVTEIKKMKLTVQEILSELQEKISEEDHNLICNSCGLTYAQFRKQTRLGCEHCYESFGPKLELLIKRIHGATHHTGKTITNTRKRIADYFELKRLRNGLKTAIQNEDYETAARIRDTIKRMRETK